MSTDLNLNSLISFTKNNKLVIELDKYISSTDGKERLEGILDKISISGDLDTLLYFGITTVYELNDLLVTNKKLIKDFSKNFFITYSLESTESFKKGICYFYLAYILMITNDNINFQKDYLSNFNIGTKDERDEFIANLNLIYQQITVKESK